MAKKTKHITGHDFTLFCLLSDIIRGSNSFFFLDVLPVSQRLVVQLAQLSTESENGERR